MDKSTLFTLARECYENLKKYTPENDLPPQTKVLIDLGTLSLITKVLQDTMEMSLEDSNG